VGIGTIVFALCIGPSVGYGLRVAGWLGRATTQAPSGVPDVDEPHPELEA
jgi:hypothetical protein